MTKQVSDIDNRKECLSCSMFILKCEIDFFKILNCLFEKMLFLVRRPLWKREICVYMYIEQYCCSIKHSMEVFESMTFGLISAGMKTYAYLLRMYLSGVDVMITIFCIFCQFSVKKLTFYSKNQCYDHIFCKTSCSLSKKRQYFSWIFRRKYLKNHNIGPRSQRYAFICSWLYLETLFSTRKFVTIFVRSQKSTLKRYHASSPNGVSSNDFSQKSAKQLFPKRLFPEQPLGPLG
jgi:hypothetical protein